MDATFWLGAEGETQAPDSDAMRNLTDLLRRVSLLEFEVAQMKPSRPWAPFDIRTLKIGTPPTALDPGLVRWG
jgi:hypothetical protein